MEIQENIENIRNLILTHKKPSHQTTNKKEVSVRCPYCGDSKSNQSATHMYIEMKPPFRFHCFKCETSGVLNQETFRDLGIFNTELSLSVINANKSFRSNKGIQKVSYKKRKLINTPVDSLASMNAVNYFNNRYGTNFTNEFIVNTFKAVTDPLNFFKENNIFVPNGVFDYSNAIGFISSDSSHIVFRDIGGRSEKRYNNLNIIPNDDVSTISKTYNISGNIDIMQEKTTLVITEGIFDIIGVYNHFYQNTDNTIFAAACGKAYNAVILNYIRMGFLNLDVVIFSDADVNINFYKALKNNSPYLKNSRITVFYNDLYDPKTGYGKDYGVRKEDIKLKKIII